MRFSIVDIHFRKSQCVHVIEHRVHIVINRIAFFIIDFIKIIIQFIERDSIRDKKKHWLKVMNHLHRPGGVFCSLTDIVDVTPISAQGLILLLTLMRAE